MKDNKNEKNDRVNDSINQSSSFNSNNSKMKKYNYVILKITDKNKGIVAVQLIKSGHRDKPKKPRSAPVWFQEFEKKINKKIDDNQKKQQQFNEKMIQRMDKIESDINNIVKLNNLKR